MSTPRLQLKWSQTNEFVTVVIESPDAVVAESEVIDNGATVQVSGWTATGGKLLFKVELRLYEPVEEPVVSIVCGGRAGPVCKMRKLRAGATWPRLAQDVVVAGCVISRDWDRWCNDDDSDDEGVPGGGPMFDAPNGYDGMVGDGYDNEYGANEDGGDDDANEDGGDDDANEVGDHDDANEVGDHDDANEDGDDDEDGNSLCDDSSSCSCSSNNDEEEVIAAADEIAVTV
jgi:hypothetical protein